jgi:gamma-glutamyl:cysteine ligase YbdK (ATP-grasp superfamily)
MSGFVPLSVRDPPLRAFRAGRSGQDAPLVDRREEQALNELDRVARTVEQLRAILVAATKAELEAIRKQQAAEASPR